MDAFTRYKRFFRAFSALIFVARTAFSLKKNLLDSLFKMGPTSSFQNAFGFFGPDFIRRFFMWNFWGPAALGIWTQPFFVRKYEKKVLSDQTRQFKIIFIDI